MLLLALAYAGGIAWARFAAAALWTPPNWQLAAAGLLIVFATLSRKSYSVSCAASLAAAFLIGLAQANLGTPQRLELLQPELQNQQVEITGVVTRASLPMLEQALRYSDPQSSLPEIYQQIDVLTSQVRLLDDGEHASPRTMTLGVRVSNYQGVDTDDAPGASIPSGIQYGELVRIRGRIRLPQEYQNPGAFDYRRYLLEQGICAVLSASPGGLEVLPGTGGSLAGRTRDRVRRSLLQHTLGLQSSNQSGVFAVTRSDTALLAAMLLGERSLLDEQAKIDFQRTGSYHLLVVSGMAVAVLGFTIFLLLRAIRLPETVATLLSALGLAAYISVTDLGAPVQRAALMCAAYLLARLFYRERNALNAVGIAGLVVLAADSRSLFDAGFQMTFIAVLTIAGIAIPILERSTRPRRAALYQLDALGYDLHLEARQAQLRVMLRMMLGRLEQLLPRWIARLLLLGGPARSVAHRGADLGLGAHAGGISGADGGVLSSCDYFGPARKPGRRAARQRSSADCDGDNAAQLRRSMAGMAGQVLHRNLAARYAGRCIHVCASARSGVARARSASVDRSLLHGGACSLH